MAGTTQEIFERIAFIKGQIERTLQRCQNSPYPTFERTDKIQALHQEATEISEGAAAEMRRLEGPAGDAIERLRTEVAQKHAEIQELQRRRQDLASVHQARQSENQARVREATLKKQPAAQFTTEWQTVAHEHQTAQAEMERQRAELTAELSDLNARQQIEQSRLESERERVRQSPAPDSIRAAYVSMQGVLDRAGVLEKEIASGASVELGQKAAATFSAKTEDFSDAEKHHRSEARLMLAAMFLVLVMVSGAIYQLFVVPHLPGLAPIDTNATHKTAAVFNVERIVLLATGRLAILLFSAWTVKYLADLHRAHSEQAIIYRDRRAALGVAELLLNATPELEQKRSMLATLTNVYLNFENSAFVTRRPSSPTGPQELTLEGQVKQIKELVGAVEPILEVVGKAATKR